MASAKRIPKDREDRFVWGEGDVKVLTAADLAELEKKEAERRKREGMNEKGHQ